MEDRSIDEETLAKLTLFSGWLGSHKFYIGQDSLGALYFISLLIGIMTTVHFPIYVGFTIPFLEWELNFNIGYIFLFLPFVLSFIDYLLQKREYVTYRYQRTEENQTIVFVTQAIMLLLLFVPLVLRGWSS